MMTFKRSLGGRLVLWLLVGSVGSFGGLLLLLFLVILLASSALSALVPLSAPAPGLRPPGAGPALVSDGVLPLRVTRAWTGLRNQAVVDEALHVASGLYRVPPETNDTWYDASRIADVVQYWSAVCTGSCSANWAEGNLQCVMLITVSYALAGQALPFVGNAIDFWTSGAYFHQPGWQAVSASAVPFPGDIAVMANGGFGHVVIVVDVKLPDPAGQGGYVQFAQSNGPGAINQMPLVRQDQGFVMGIWPGYQIEGYIRHMIALAE